MLTKLNHKFIIKLFVLFVFLYSTNLKSQISPKDSIIEGFMIDFHYGFHFPEGDLKDRFGNSSTAGAGVFYKTKKNFLYQINFNYEFGTDVKIEDELFENIYTSEKFIIDGDGLYAEHVTQERAWYVLGKVGKIFPIIGVNDNCGPFIMIGGGYLQHKIRITCQDNTAPQIKDDYKKGYDRLTGGYTLYQQIGYFNIGNKKAYSLTASFEIMEAFTKPMRNYQYDLMGPEPNKTRMDILWGFRLSWMIPLFKEPSDGYFTN